jgi:hypothetical protein
MIFYVHLCHKNLQQVQENEGEENMAKREQRRLRKATIRRSRRRR